MSRLPLIAMLLTGCNEYDLAAYEAVDVFFQEPAAQVDVLLVVDDSGSMQLWQVLLGARFDEFLSWFEAIGVDYRMAVVTTTTEIPTWAGQGCDEDDLAALTPPGTFHLDTVVTPDTPDAAAVFDEIVRVGTCGSGYERGLEAAALALSPEMLEGPNAGFLRPDAHLSLVFLSDEQDTSPEPVHHYVNAYHEVKGQRARDVFNASAIVITDLDACPIVGGSSEGSRYVEVVEQTGGVLGNLCNTEWEELVSDISFNASRLRDTWFLSEPPDLSTLQVSIDDELVPCGEGGWTYDLVEDQGEPRPALRFDRAHLPPPGAQMAARYNLGSGEPTGTCPPVEAE